MVRRRCDPPEGLDRGSTSPSEPQTQEKCICEHLRKSLEDTQEEHLVDADEAGLSGFTLQSLRDFRSHIQNLNREEVELLMYVH